MTVPVLSADLTCYDTPRGGCRGRTQALTQTFRQTHTHTHTHTHTQWQTQGIEDLGASGIRKSHHVSDLTVDAFSTLNKG